MSVYDGETIAVWVKRASCGDFSRTEQGFREIGDGEMSEIFKMEDGRFVIDETNYNNLSYRNAIALSEEYRQLHDEIKKCEKTIQENTAKIKKHVMEEFTPKHLPATFKCVSVEIKNYDVVAEWQSEQMKCQRITRKDPEKQPEPDKQPEPVKEKDVYQLLSERYDFKQILNSGVLTKEEKRKCLGLPELKDQPR